ncbi:DUF397 domain-containing protein [Actinomadura mexicana]|uniref:DUF397 domain-containing protein n=1 Tax=Actinomadura mexicana TaxID=134959 RepID=A0A239APQ9_9ACTN|nr:DUF397 domain-containing protein [Actinomadura mexicana]SNR97696.1 protein of unknown function [Actinomadura mexicana]
MSIWRKSSRSGSTTIQSDCVEVARIDGVVGLRDSKAPTAGHLTMSPSGFTEFIARVKQGDLGI